jgi:hypothetical protein
LSGNRFIPEMPPKLNHTFSRSSGWTACLVPTNSLQPMKIRRKPTYIPKKANTESNCPDVAYDLSMVYRELKQNQQAYDVLQKAIAADPENFIYNRPNYFLQLAWKVSGSDYGRKNF